MFDRNLLFLHTFEQAMWCTTAIICLIWPFQFSVIMANHASGTWSPPQHIDINAYWGRPVFGRGAEATEAKMVQQYCLVYLPACLTLPMICCFCKTAFRHQLFRCPSSFAKLQDVSLLSFPLHIWDHFHNLPRQVTTVWLCHLFSKNQLSFMFFNGVLL